MFYICLIFLLTVSVPHDIRLIFLHSGKDDDSAANTQRLSLCAKGHFEFVNDGCFKGDAMLSTETICRRETKLKQYQ